jgi:hypothetical protein
MSQPPPPPLPLPPPPPPPSNEKPNGCSGGSGSDNNNRTRRVRFMVPTARNEERREIDITSLTDEEIILLHQQDPFLFYSIFRPTHNQDLGFADVAPALQNNGNGGGPGPVMVERQSRLSTEMDAVTYMARMLGMVGHQDADDDEEMAEAVAE